MERATKCIPIPTAKRFVKQCIVAGGAKEVHAQAMADTLIAADHRGHFSHGLNRLEMYVKDIQTGSTVGDGEPVTLKESAATAHVDGKNNLGPVVGNYCMKLAIKKAKECGVGWVVAKGSNHYGIAGFYALQAVEEGLVGFSFTNSTPCLRANRSSSYTLGSNPISCAAPAVADDAFVLDMATSTAAYGRVEINHRKGIPIPNGWGADPNGRETNEPSEVLNGGGLLPLGGAEESGGYKGYGLAMMVEMLCGILGGGAYGPNVRKWGTTSREANLGQCFIALNPDMFCDGFGERMQDLMDSQRNLTPSEKDKPVLVAGDPERMHIKKCEELGGIPYPTNVVDHMNGLAKELGVKPM
ncbi:putative oxidoreductase YjmC isoform X2 [Styela clava]